jgi:hypothetical protein
MSNGKIIEAGTHNELLSKKVVYYLLVKARNISAFNEEAILVIEKNLNAANSHQKKGLERGNTRVSGVSVSSHFIEDFKSNGYYEPEIKTRSAFILIKTVNVAFYCYIYGYIF